MANNNNPSQVLAQKMSSRHSDTLFVTLDSQDKGKRLTKNKMKIESIVNLLLQNKIMITDTNGTKKCTKLMYYI